MFKKIKNYFLEKKEAENEIRNAIEQNNQAIITTIYHLDIPDQIRYLILYQLLIFKKLSKRSKFNMLYEIVKETNQEISKANKNDSEDKLENTNIIKNQGNHFVQ